MPVEHHYIVLLTSVGAGTYDEPEAFGPFETFDAAEGYAEKTMAEDPRLEATVLPVKPVE